MIIMPLGLDHWEYQGTQSEKGRIKCNPQWDLGNQYRCTEKQKKQKKLCHNLLYNTCITTGPDFFSSHNAQRSIFYLHFNCNLKVFMKKKKMKENATKKSENVNLCLYLNFLF